jgi:hypothetical protein
MSPCFNWAPRRKFIIEEWSGQLHAPAALSTGKEPLAAIG